MQTDTDNRPKRFKGKHVIMCGSDWHTDERIQSQRYESRIDAFMLALMRCLKAAGGVPVQWVPYEDIFAAWKETHLTVLSRYGVDPDTAEAKTTSWLNTIQVVGQAIREIMPHTWDSADESIRRKQTKTMFLVNLPVLIPAHLSLFNGRLRSETRDLFLKDSAFGGLYQKALADARARD